MGPPIDLSFPDERDNDTHRPGGFEDPSGGIAAESDRLTCSPTTSSPSAAILLDDLVRSGRNPATISALTLAECLVRPFRVGPAAAGAVHGAISGLPNLAIADVTVPAAHEAARIRALTGLRLPDATILATAATSGIPHVVANDARWSSAIEAARLPLALCHLEGIASA
jgi:predicted nucleic acid-binding protein